MKKKTFFVSALVLIGLHTSTNKLSAQSFDVNLFAGTTNPGYSGDGGQATAAQIQSPFGVVADDSGNVYIADQDNYVIRKVNTNGIISTYAGNGTAGYSGDGGPATAAEFYTPDGLGADAAGNIYVTDDLNENVRVINKAGIISTLAGNGTSGYSGDGGPATAAELYHPNGNVIVDLSGNVLIPEYGNCVIRKVNTSGIISTLIGNGVSGYYGDGGPASAAELNSPYSLIQDASGNIYIADLGNNRIRKVNTGGIISTVAGNGAFGYNGDGGPATAAELYGPEGVAVDAWGNLYECEAYSATVRIINSGNIITTVAGNGDLGYFGNGGPATAAEFMYPSLISFDKSGNIYVADQDNDCIRKLSNLEEGIERIMNGNGQVRVYPNPCNGEFTLQINNASSESVNRIEIYNLTGEMVYAASTNTVFTRINMTNNAAGIYFYRVFTEKGNLVSSGKLMTVK